MWKTASLALAAFAFGLPLQAEIIDADASHYVLKHEARSELTAAEMWNRILLPSTWWRPEHTYSGDSANLSLDPSAGGLWREDWPGGSVAHGEVVYLKTGETLRLSAPFGPLQALGVTVIWTISVKPDGEGSIVTFDEVASGTPASGLDRLAEAVNSVKADAIQSLVAPE